MSEFFLWHFIFNECFGREYFLQEEHQEKIKSYKNFIKIKIKKQLKSLTIDLKVISGKFFELFCPQFYTYAFDTQLVN